MEFRILGPIEVVEGGRQLTPRRAKQRALLTVLLLHPNEVVTTDTLVDALWGETPPETADSALHGHVSALRKLLGAERIETRPHGYLLHVGPHELDAERGETLLAHARDIRNPAPRVELLREVLGLWRGEPLGDVRDETFARSEIARLEELRASALEERIEAELELGEHARLLPELDRLVRLHPLRERLRAQLMLALYRNGRQSDALHAYQEGRKLLSAELGIDPGAALQTLERQILAQDRALDPARPAIQLQPRQERKTVTVLIAEYTALTPTDPEDLERLVGLTLERAIATITRFGGTAERLFSNAVLGVFGGLQVHEDDAERAARSALSLRGDLSQMEGLQIRVGIERGQALVTIQADGVQVTGDVLSAVSRLQGAGPEGAIVAGESAHRATREAIRYEPFGHAAWLAQAVIGRVATDHSVIPFVGRLRELALLGASYERAVSQSAAQLVTVLGAPGSGKTRLVEEFRALVATRGAHIWREGRCLPYGEGITFWALGEIVKAHARILESDGSDESSRKLTDAVAALRVESDEQTWLLSNLAPLVGLAGSATPSRDQSFSAWRRFIEAIASHGPLVILIEDIHWADTALLEFIDDLVDRAMPAPLLVVCTARLELLDEYPAWGGGKRNATTITLGPLSERETTEIARSVLNGETPPRELVRRAGGNPLFARELARVIGADSPLPETLEAVIAARLDALARHVKAAAMDAAVIGEVFWSGALAAIANVDEGEIDERLRRLVAGDVVRQARSSSVAGQREYAFIHVLVRDVAYQQIPKSARAKKHEAVAAWIERLAGERAGDRAELIAHHYAAALELASPVGERASVLAEKARRFLIMAGDRAMALDIAAAERFYRRSLDLLAYDDRARPRVLSAIARAAADAGRPDDSIRLYEEAIVGFRSQRDPLGLGHALAQLSNVLWRRSGTSTSVRSLLAEAIEVLERETPGPELVEAYVLFAARHTFVARGAASLILAGKLMKLAQQLGLRHQVSRALQFRGMARCYLNDLGGLDDLREGLRLGLEIGAGFETAAAYANLGEWLFWTEGPTRCLELHEEGIDFSERRGLAHVAYWLRHSKLGRLFDLGRWDELIAIADEVLAWDRAHGPTQISAAARIEKAGVLVRRGAVAEAKSLVDAAMGPARKADDPQPEELVPALVCAALVEHANGDDVRTVRYLEEIERSTRDRAPAYRALWLTDVARLCVATREIELATRLMTDLDVVASRHVHSVMTARAVLAEAVGNVGEALKGYTEAATRWREFGNVVEEAYALLGRGRCLVALGRDLEAEEPLNRAREFLAKLGARRT